MLGRGVACFTIKISRLSEKIEIFINDFVNQSTRYHYVRIGKRMCENTFLPSSTPSEKAEAPRLQPAPTLAASTRACSQHPRLQPAPTLAATMTCVQPAQVVELSQKK